MIPEQIQSQIIHNTILYIQSRARKALTILLLLETSRKKLKMKIILRRTLVTRRKLLKKNLKLPADKNLLHQPPKHQTSPRHLIHCHHRLPRHVPLVHLQVPGFRGHGLHLAQVVGLRAVLLVEQVNPHFNAVTASARDKENKGHVELN